MIISNCAITLSDSELLRPCVMSTSDPEFTKTKEFHTGIDIAADNVFVVYYGRVVFIGDEDSGRTVVIQTGSSFCICYKRLKSVTVSLNDIVDVYTLVGFADKFVHVEVYTQDISDWPVRVGAATWYKADANLSINGGLQALSDYAYKQNYKEELPSVMYETTWNNLVNNSEDRYGVQ